MADDNARTPVILLACGTFNPITCMHLHMFELARDYMNKDGRWYVIGGLISPVSDAYDKEKMTTAEHRCEMVRLAIKDTDWIRLSLWESEQSTWTETVSVLKYHQSNFQSVLGNAKDPIPFYRSLQEAVGGNQQAGSAEFVDFEAPVPDRSQRRLMQTDRVRVRGVPRVMLLCGADLLESFATPNAWNEEDVERIARDFGIICVTRFNYNPDKFVYENEILNRYEFNIFVAREWMLNDEISATKIRRSVQRGNSIRYLVPDNVVQYIEKNRLYVTADRY